MSSLQVCQHFWQECLVTLFCCLDDFCHTRPGVPPLPGKRKRARSLSDSEIMTLLVAFHQSQYRCFKAFYLGYVCRHLKAEFPKLVSYQRFIEWIPGVIDLLRDYLSAQFGKSSGVCFIDSTALPVCHNKRIAQHKVFKEQAQRGKTSVDWFYGFKLHLVINHEGQLLGAKLTQGNVHDSVPAYDLLAPLSGKAYADKGYLSRLLKEQLKQVGVGLVTKVKKNMKLQELSPDDALFLGKRGLIETVIDQIKNQSQVQHTRHRAQTGFMSNLLAALIAYSHQANKPKITIA
jgi:hypothetical protein